MTTDMVTEARERADALLDRLRSGWHPTRLDQWLAHVLVLGAGPDRGLTAHAIRDVLRAAGPPVLTTDVAAVLIPTAAVIELPSVAETTSGRTAVRRVLALLEAVGEYPLRASLS